MDSSSSDEEDIRINFALQQGNLIQQYGAIACLFGAYYNDKFMNKSMQRQPKVTGMEWVMTTMRNSVSCFNMFKMSREIFDRLHCLLVASYGLKGEIEREMCPWAISIMFW
jgi:hypothetical protein